MVLFRTFSEMDKVQIGDLKLSKELEEKLIGSDREGLGLRLGIGLGLGIIDPRSERDRRSEPNTALLRYGDLLAKNCLFFLPLSHSAPWLPVPFGILG